MVFQMLSFAILEESSKAILQNSFKLSVYHSYRRTPDPRGRMDAPNELEALGSTASKWRAGNAHQLVRLNTKLLGR